MWIVDWYQNTKPLLAETFTFETVKWLWYHLYYDKRDEPLQRSEQCYSFIML